MKTDNKNVLLQAGVASEIAMQAGMDFLGIADNCLKLE